MRKELLKKKAKKKKTATKKKIKRISDLPKADEIDSMLEKEDTVADEKEDEGMSLTIIMGKPKKPIRSIDQLRKIANKV